MKKNYAEPIILMISFEEADVITASIGAGDNTLEDGFFD